MTREIPVFQGEEDGLDISECNLVILANTHNPANSIASPKFTNRPNQHVGV